MRRILAIAALALVSSTAHANIPESPLVRSTDAWASGETPPTLLDTVACNAAAAARTWTMVAQQGKGFATGAFQLDFTQNAATLLTIQVQGSLNSQTSWATIPACDDVTDGTCALTGSSQYTRDVSGGSENFMFRADFNGAPDIKLIVTCTGGGASDFISLYGRLAAQ